MYSRNRSREIFSNLHIRGNTDVDDDRYFKVIPLFDIFNVNFKRFVSANNCSVYESMISYYGRHGTKQFVRGKPIQFGFKLWFLCSSDGTVFIGNHTVEKIPICQKQN